MLIGPPIPEMQLFKKMILKIQGQCHGWGQRSKSQRESNFLSTHILFVPSQSGIPMLSYDFFKIWPWNSRVKVTDEVTVQSHNVGITSYRLTSIRSMSIGPPIPEIQHFQNLTLKIKGQGHWWSHSSSQNEGLTSYRLTSLFFQGNRASHSWVMTFSKFDLENQRSRSWVGSQFKVTMWV